MYEKKSVLNVLMSLIANEQHLRLERFFFLGKNGWFYRMQITYEVIQVLRICDRHCRLQFYIKLMKMDSMFSLYAEFTLKHGSMLSVNFCDILPRFLTNLELLNPLLLASVFSS